MRVTMRMVAEQAGVSRGTVDRVINKRGSVKPDVEKKVLDTIERLEYKPNTVARALAFNKNTKKLGVLLPDQQGYFSTEVNRGIRKIIEESKDLGIKVLTAVCDPNNPGDYVKKMDEMIGAGVAGLAISAQNSPILVEKINELDALGIPVVTINSDIPGSRRKCFVGQDTFQSGRVAAEIIYKHLRDGGRILVVAGIPEFNAHVNRVRGFEEYMSDRGVDKNCWEVIYTYEKYELTYGKISEMLGADKEIRYIYMAIGGIVACGEAVKGMGMQGQTFIVSHDTTPSTIELLKEGLVDFVIEQDMFMQGYRSIQLLRDYLLLDKGIENEHEKTVFHIVSSECV
ncbi:LacI family DNA-binding transcriptional regulator [Anaerotalea alkaliphila]|uniref:Substrate-binding domain-containing protein n=1 Tax=Anaerotalea alkaliphila TaxID=2662126 RepID=A0A7X5HXR1_9FIRM|nr:LacI family DNA-binding transcriptional regulator [Anaerotalea alkaliphila]NDL68565.1 substrate-binding domain-containing protein [Anaerotalea alkaliphila]